MRNRNRLFRYEGQGILIQDRSIQIPEIAVFSTVFFVLLWGRWVKRFCSAGALIVGEDEQNIGSLPISAKQWDAKKKT